MKTETILVANLKCSGCANTITQKVSGITGVKKVVVDPGHDSVTVDYEESTPRTEITKKLHELGYPEATEENGLLLQLKSYASCMIGRINK
ncbi:MAG: heavy-metal-associated domain-containing protein [Bacteroidia bacterium]